jgi:hypothetical protein
MPGEKLCLHGFIGLHDMTWRDDFDFERFYWPGLDSDEKTQQKFLNVALESQQILVEPKLHYGGIFRPGIGFLDNKHIILKQQTESGQGKDAGRKEVMAFCLCYSVGGFSDAILPIMVPCLAKTGKDGKTVESILQFATGPKPVTKISYTANQTLLRDISLQQYELAKNWDKMVEEDSGMQIASTKVKLFDLWRQAFPLLVKEEFCCAYYLHWLKYLKSKPRAKCISAGKFSMDRPFLSFILKFHGDHFSLFAEVHINGQLLKASDLNKKPPLILFDEKRGSCYLMSSVQDDDLLCWMLHNHNRLTVWKQHFIEFHHSFLKQLSKCYPVSFITKGGKRIKYAIDEVLNNASIVLPPLS